MHRRSVSSSAAGTESVLVQKRGDHHYVMANRSPEPSRLKAEGEAPAHGDAPRAAAGTRTSSLGQGAKAVDRSLSDDQIVCQSKLYDAFELQELEQQLDRKLVLAAPDQCKTRSSCSSSMNDRPLPKSMKSLYTAYSLLDDHPSPKHLQANHLQAPMNSSRKRAAEADHGGTDHHDGNQASYSGPFSDQDLRLAKAARSFSMPRAGSQDQHMGAVDHLKSKATEGAQEKRMIRKNEIGNNALSRWSLINSFFRSQKDKQNRLVLDVQEAPSQIFNQQHRDVHHHHYIHYHHVHHHYHHHHSVHGVHYEEIDWPLSPARLQELDFLAHDK